MVVFIALEAKHIAKKKIKKYTCPERIRILQILQVFIFTAVESIFFSCLCNKLNATHHLVLIHFRSV